MKMRKLLGLLLMGAAMFSSCGNDHEDLYDPNAVALMKANEYSKAFIAKFGNIDPNHTWDASGVSLKGRAIIPNANQWQSDYNLSVPSEISESEYNTVVAWFNENRNPTSMTLEWSDFFVQHVYGNENKSLKDGSTVISKMNKLYAGEEHVYNFNAQYGSIMFVQDGTSSSFSYENSYDGSKRHYEYTIQCINGSYYLAFDFCTSESANEYVPCDGYYNDWILKLTPAATARVIAEDLGNIGDFDFNDVVFDVWTTNTNRTVITIQAAGGTLPLTVAGKEVHKLFGVDENVMINTGNGESKAPIMFDIAQKLYYNEIEVKVNDSSVGTYVLRTEKSKAPQKIFVPANFQWTSERQSIEDKYPNFNGWVGDSAVDWLN